MWTPLYWHLNVKYFQSKIWTEIEQWHIKYFFTNNHFSLIITQFQHDYLIGIKMQKTCLHHTKVLHDKHSYGNISAEIVSFYHIPQNYA